MPGFGKADKPDDFNYSIEGYKEHLNLLIEELGLKKVDLAFTTSEVPGDSRGLLKMQTK